MTKVYLSGKKTLRKSSYLQSSVYTGNIEKPFGLFIYSFIYTAHLRQSLPVFNSHDIFPMFSKHVIEKNLPHDDEDDFGFFETGFLCVALEPVLALTL